MNPNEIKKRLHSIPATPYQKKGSYTNISRRDNNHIIFEEITHSDDEDDFFGLESEYRLPRPAREVADDFLNQENHESSGEQQQVFFELKPLETFEFKNPDRSIEIEASEIPRNLVPIIMVPLKNEDSYEYMQCSFSKSDGERCKRQSLKNIDVCGIHKKYLEKNAG